MRKPPPKEFQFLPGQSGFPKGKPKGTISRKKLVQKVALKEHSFVLAGAQTRQTLLGLVTLKVKSMAMEGHPGAAALLDWVRAQLDPSATEPQGGFLVVPERCKTVEEMEQAIEEYNRDHQLEPGSEEWYRARSQGAAAKPEKAIDPDSPLARAMREFERKWGHNPSSVS